MSKAARLEIAGALAPVLRSAPDRVRSRPVKLYNQKTGEVTGHTTLGEAQQGMLRTLAIEVDVQDGVRPKEVICRQCGKPVPVGPRGTPPVVCQGGGCKRQETCAHDGCSKPVPPKAFSPAVVARRNGGPWRCKRHAMDVEAARARALRQRARERMAVRDRSKENNGT